ncbi:hypothetical protein DPMN_013806 [Dreissena polymorpha]|uniref:Uncharacterized protein n=1 Tax=Dreissena polymorpha TaxID=45954 RepID=A0A9D4N9M7_DREPO|nr:hypothetical protein DPMN_013806 [Dreissena polymorpha]
MSFKLSRDFFGTNVLPKKTAQPKKYRKNFQTPQRHCTKNVTSRVLQRFYSCLIWKMPCLLVAMFIGGTITIFKLSRAIIGTNVLTNTLAYIIKTNVLTKFHENWTKNVTSGKKGPTPGGNVFQPTRTMFELVRDFIGKPVLTKFDDF